MSDLIELIAVQPSMQLVDYHEVDVFCTKIAALTERVAAARDRDSRGDFRHPALVVFPEHIGKLLSIAGYGDLAQNGDDVDDVLLAESAKMDRTCHRAFQASAGVEIVARPSANPWP